MSLGKIEWFCPSTPLLLAPRQAVPPLETWRPSLPFSSGLAERHSVLKRYQSIPVNPRVAEGKHGGIAVSSLANCQCPQ